MRFHLDEQMDHAIATGLRRRGIDVTTTSDARLVSASDLEHIEYARRTHRVIVTEDTDYLTHANAGVEHNGIVFCRRTLRTIGQIIEFLVLIDACLSEEDMRGEIEYC